MRITLPRRLAALLLALLLLLPAGLAESAPDAGEAPAPEEMAEPAPAETETPEDGGEPTPVPDADPEADAAPADESPLTIVDGVVTRCARDAAGTVAIPEGVTEIAYAALSGCAKVTGVTIPASVVKIDGYAFSSSGLTEVRVPGTVREFGYGVFFDCQSLRTATLEAGPTEVPAGMFQNCRQLAAVTLPASATAIRDRAFDSCAALSGIDLGNVTEIGDSAFYGCEKLTGISLGARLESIGHYAFAGCNSIEALTFPASLRAVGQYAFQNCKSLKNLTVRCEIPKAQYSGNEFDGCELVQTVYDCETVTGFGAAPTVVLTDAARTIGFMAFDCVDLRDITIPEGVTTIEARAFLGRLGLESIRLPESLTSIGAEAFSGSGLTALTIPDDVTALGEKVCERCEKLETLRLGRGVEALPAGVSDGA